MRDAELTAVRASNLGIKRDEIEVYMPSLPAYLLILKLSLYLCSHFPFLVNNFIYLFIHFFGLCFCWTVSLKREHALSVLLSVIFSVPGAEIGTE